MDLSIGLRIDQSAPTFAGDFKSFMPGWDFLIQSDRGVSATGGIVDTWTDQAAGIVGTAPTGAQKPIVIAGPNGKPAIQSVNGQNTSVAFPYSMPAPQTRMTWAYSVVRQDAWTLNGALFGSPGAEFDLRVLQFDTSPKLALNQNVVTVGGSAIGTYGALICSFYGGLPGDTIKYGSGSAITGLLNNTGISSLTVFNQLNALPIRASICMLGFRTSPLSAAQLAQLNAAVASYYGPSVEL